MYLTAEILRSHGFKKPLSESNKVVVFKQLEADAEYIRLLKCHARNQFICEANRRTGFVGFLVCIKSI